jgi:S-DNA-T family DNA segregation ATPase FtsK/SpoIIIE
MARKPSNEAEPTHHHGLGDVIGIVLVATALLLLVALFSYDRTDAHREPANESVHNLIGPFGATISTVLFFTFGVGAFVLPLLMLVFGLGYLFQFLAYIRSRWLWGATLLLSCLGLFGFYSRYLDGVRRGLNIGNAGGLIGSIADTYVRGFFGLAGATIIFFTLYLVSLLYLTNFQLGVWLRTSWAKRAEGKEEDEEKALEKKARELEKQTKKLQEELGKPAKMSAKADSKADAKGESKGETPAEKSSSGADMRSFPEPTVRDLSVPTSKPGKGKKPSSDAPEPPAEMPGEIISAREIVSATTDQILGKPDKKAAREKEPATEEALAAEAPATAEAADPEMERPEPLPAPVITLGPKPKPAKKSKPIAVAAPPTIGNYQLPSIDFLQHPDMNVKPTESKEELMANARLMQSTLAQFDIDVALGDITKGPTITRYELHPAPGVRLEKITALNNNIAAALKAERINILAPVPGKSSVGVEVPNLVKTKVIMRDLLESEEWQNTKARIPLALGKDVYGQPIIADLGEMPHLLIAGSTGSGKSVCINSIIASLLYRFSPDQLRFVMIDPKVVELQQYNALPHLVVPVVNDPKKVILALRWVVNEMEKRYQIFAKVGVRNIKSFNDRPKNKPEPKREPELPLTVTKEKVEAGQEGFAVELDEEIVVPRDEEIVIPEKLSYIVVIIDELADLMLVAPADVEMAIARITQMARAAGIHCIVATQRPSVDVITGVIKANIPARIAFQVAAKVDSRTILDAMGADKLLGKGDMLYLPPGSAKLIRAQGVLITDQEIQNIVDFIAQQGKPSYEMEIHQQLQKPASSLKTDDNGCDEDEDLIQQCIEVIRSEQKASVSLMQRRLRLGYTRAARIMDELENRGIVGPSKGAEPRDILLDLDAGAPAAETNG